ncbi:DUF4367 domain-containing protein [Brevibacillus sp. B_LB10_24]|uniref:DUF4367 domain-containing protein n=1 Tax=Brevibacillus sp. B_LB10_24 TaxID=3380645 RepID=UPI0038BB515E
MKPDNQECNRENQLDSFASKAVNSMYSQINIPSGEESWKQMQAKLLKMQRRSRRKRTIKIGLAIAGFSILIGSFFSTTNESFAFRNLFTMVKSAEQGLVHILFGENKPVDTSGAKTPPPPDYLPDQATVAGSSPVADDSQSDEIVKPEITTVEQASKKLDFQIRHAGYIPEGFSEFKVKLYQDADGKYRILRIEYKNNEEDLFVLTQRNLVENSTGWRTTINEASGIIKDVDINGTNGVLVQYTEGGARLEWLSDNVMLDIYGKLTEDQILAIARSLQ